ncbi:hypothetical protein GCM10028792_15500 [Salinisphaera aquimarina]
MTGQPGRSYLPVSARPLERGERLLAMGYSGDLKDGYFLQIDYGCEVTSVGEAGHFGNSCVI